MNESVRKAQRVRLFHFSDDGTITRFVPRSVKVPSMRPPGQDWLNGPLVWAIDAWHAPLYLFPRECPRILLWRKPSSTRADIDQCWRASDCRMVAYIEHDWLEPLRTATLYRYALPDDGFEDLADAGMHVHRGTVAPMDVRELNDLPSALRAVDVELRAVDTLLPLKPLWDTSLHVSGIRLRNAKGW